VPGPSDTETDLRSALSDGQFQLMYQPIYDLGELSLVGFEALLRWNHPTLGQIQPEAFLPALEASGLIVEVGRWVLLEACGQMAGWRSAGSPLTMSVNVSARQLSRDGLVDDVREALEQSGLEPTALTIEVAETALLNGPEATARRLHGLKNLGVQVAIDDFGTGYSSLAYLRQFPVDCLKIDRTFIEAVTRSPQAEALIHTLVQLGQDLGLKTLAEGVETTEQMTHLRAENVNSVQGFLFARPLTVQAIDADILRTEPDPA
jgi:EAL domain-containing protein (putative c-di-GMP-specific phosphodiesterase class I)